MYWWLYAQLASVFVMLFIIVMIAWRGAKKVRRDIFKLAGVKEEEEDEPE